MPPVDISPDLGVGRAWKFYAAAANVNLATVAGKPQRAARKVIALAAGNWTLLKDSGGNDDPPGAVFQGFELDADVSAITSSAAILVVW